MDKTDPSSELTWILHTSGANIPLDHVKLKIGFDCKIFQNCMREGENKTQVREKMLVFLAEFQALTTLIKKSQSNLGQNLVN